MRRPTLLPLLLLLLLPSPAHSAAAGAWRSDAERTVARRGTHGGSPASPLDLRVVPAQGGRPGGGDPATALVRISVITNATAPLTSPADTAFFDYAQPFQHRWTNKFLHSALKNVSVGGTTTFVINGTKVGVTVPAPRAGTRGVVIADPCFHGAAAGCTYGERFQTFSRMTHLLNLAAASVDYWMILGDNFYDRDGHLAQKWFDQLTLQTKSKLFATVAGNHDYWGLGTPFAALDADQYGNGNMQFYAMDSVAALTAEAASSSSSVPGAFLDFSVDPDAAATKHHLAALENFFTYTTIGNVAFILFSGGYTFDDTKPHFEDACRWLADVAQPDVAFVAGHWNDRELGGALGCQDKMDVPDVFDAIRGFDGCRQLDAQMQLKFIMGHTHCNKVTASDPRASGQAAAMGMMVAGQGMEGCGNFGVPIVDTTADGRLEVYYYEIQSTESGSSDNYEAVASCFQEHGVDGCKGLADVWLNATVSPVDWTDRSSNAPATAAAEAAEAKLTYIQIQCFDKECSEDCDGGPIPQDTCIGSTGDGGAELHCFSTHLQQTLWDNADCTGAPSNVSNVTLGQCMQSSVGEFYENLCCLPNDPRPICTGPQGAAAGGGPQGEAAAVVYRQ